MRRRDAERGEEGRHLLDVVDLAPARGHEDQAHRQPPEQRRDSREASPAPPARLRAATRRVPSSSPSASRHTGRHEASYQFGSPAVSFACSPGRTAPAPPPGRRAGDRAGTPGPRGVPWRYEVALHGGRTSPVEARFAPGVTGTPQVDDDAAPFVRDLTTTTEGGWRVVRYRFALREAAAQAHGHRHRAGLGRRRRRAAVDVAAAPRRRAAGELSLSRAHRPPGRFVAGTHPSPRRRGGHLRGAHGHPGCVELRRLRAVSRRPPSRAAPPASLVAIAPHDLAPERRGGHRVGEGAPSTASPRTSAAASPRRARWSWSQRGSARPDPRRDARRRGARPSSCAPATA